MPVLIGFHAVRRLQVEAKQENAANGISAPGPLSPEELEMIRRELESLDDIAAVDDEIRGIVARNWPLLLSKLPRADED
jgi:hypothetical protein